MAFLPPHGGNIALASQVYGLSEKEIIDFSANINPLGPPPKAYEAIIKNLALITRYPDPSSRALKEQLSLHIEVPQENILIGNGASEIIYLLTNSIRPKKVMVMAPTFSEYALAAKASGAEVIEYSLQRNHDFSYSSDVAAAMNSHQIDLLFLCNPNNPVGNLIPPHYLATTIEAARKLGITVILDESFLDFTGQRNILTMARKAVIEKGLIVLYSLTKFYALPGLRLGCAVSTENTIKFLEENRDPWSVNVLAQVAGVHALQDKAFIKQTLDWLDSEKSFLYNKLSNIKGLRPLKPEVNYICIELCDPGFNSHDLTYALGKKGFLVRNCANYSNMGLSFIRIAIKERPHNELLLKCLREICGAFEGEGTNGKILSD